MAPSPASQGSPTLDVDAVRRDFPILERLVNDRPLVYLDSGASSQKPVAVIEAERQYYLNSHANIHRGIYVLSEESTLAYEQAHEQVGQFINAAWDEVIFTKNTTESLNLVAYAWGLDNLQAGDEVVTTVLEHHSNIVPWQQMAKRTGATVHYIGITSQGHLDMEQAEKLIGPRTKLVSMAHVSNVLGTINPVVEIGQMAHAQGAVFCVDGAQSIPHMPVDMQAIDCDFFAFSGHKMCGPTGIGGLYGKRELLERMEPFLYGGDMINEVSLEGSTWNDLPWKFEAGTPPIAEGIGLGAAVQYLQGIGMQVVHDYEHHLVREAMTQLSALPDIEIYGPDAEDRGGVIAFNMEGAHAHDVASILDQYGVAIRAGHHCAMPLMRELDINGACRASFYMYNTVDEIHTLIESLGAVRRMLKR
ncbi:cysteine desulfurase [Candidatus Entotheonella serta]|nr:cysteine desulfurase [Candidatus Entotheonella serta]